MKNGYQYLFLLIATMLPIVWAVRFVLYTYPRYKSDIQKLDEKFDRCDRDDRVVLKSKMQLEIGRIVRVSLFVIFFWVMVIMDYLGKFK